MAQATAKKAKVKATGKTKASKPKASRKPKAAKKPPSRSSHSTSSNGSSSGDAAKVVRKAGKAVASAGKDAGKATGHAASKAKIPLLAGGAALVGTVGGVVIGATRSGGKVLGVNLPRSKRIKIRSRDLTKAAKEVGRFGENVGELTTELKRARQGLANGAGGQNSPIEVLLRGLTNRR